MAVTGREKGSSRRFAEADEHRDDDECGEGADRGRASGSHRPNGILTAVRLRLSAIIKPSKVLARLAVALLAVLLLTRTTASASVIGNHACRDTGHRVVAFPVDAQGIPSGPGTELIGGWTEKPGQELGGPVGVVAAADGSLWVSDDRNGMVLRLTRTS